jgi:hypothetical protein
LLPSLAAILKIRKRKLVSASTNQNIALITDTNFISFIKASLDSINVKLSSVSEATSHSGVTLSLRKSLDTFSLLTENLREFNTLLFSRAQLSYLLFV